MTNSDQVDGGAFVSTAPETTAIRALGKAADGGAKKRGAKSGDRPRPWRDNIEAITISIVTIVLFKYFVLEAYKIPTGSMQPTLMGNPETGIFDRVIVDKLSYHYRDPERFEIAVFKYPLDSSKNFIKRIVGMPGEHLRVENGDLFVRKDGESEEKILRRPRPIQDAQLKLLETTNEWSPEGAARKGWAIENSKTSDRVVAASGTTTGSITYPRTQTIRDTYLDGYPLSLKSKIKQRNRFSGLNGVSDIRVAANVEVDADNVQVQLTIQEGDRRYRFVLPGPAAPAEDTAHIEAVGLDPALGPTSTYASPASTIRLKAGAEVSVEVENLNDLLRFRFDGEEICSLEVPPAPKGAEGRVRIDVDRGGAVLDDVKIWRDIYYTSMAGSGAVTSWQIPEGNYLVLGDNTQDSSDGRDWSFEQFRVTGEDGETRIVRGNSRLGGMNGLSLENNPIFVSKSGDFASSGDFDRMPGAIETIFFRDEFGERNEFKPDEVVALGNTTDGASLVSRDLIRGRAVVVVWPLAFWHDVYRLKWVR